MKNIYLIVAPSGAGKTSIVNLLEKKYGLKAIQSYTTRPPRYDGERGHIFISDNDFSELTDIVAYTEFCGYKYCTTSKQVEENDLYVIDPKGVDYFKQSYKGSKHIKIIYIESDMTVRYERMKQRGEANGLSYSEAVNNALERITNDVSEFYDYIHHNVQTDYVVENNTNDTIKDAADKIYRYIVGEEGKKE